MIFFMLYCYCIYWKTRQCLTYSSFLQLHMHIYFAIKYFFEKSFKIQTCIRIEIRKYNFVGWITANIVEFQAWIILFLSLFPMNWTLLIFDIVTTTDPTSKTHFLIFVRETYNSHSILVLRIRFGLCITKKYTKFRMLNR